MKWLYFFIVVPHFIFASNISLYLENDVIARTDQNYTHGTRVYIEKDNTPDYLKRKFENHSIISGFQVGQHLYTPYDLDEKELIVDDRPYGGWLYFGRYHIFTDNKQFHLLGVDLGVTGPPSMAKEAQTIWHKIVGSTIPQGWDNQIKFEVGVNITYRYKYKIKYKNIIDLIPQIGVNAGNIFTLANYGATIRVGYNIPDDFGYLKNEPSIRAHKDKKIGIYGFAGIDQSLICRNIFLDGNTFRSSHSVEKNRVVNEYSYGIGLNSCRFSIILTMNHRTKEFKLQKKDHSFGTCLITLKF